MFLTILDPELPNGGLVMLKEIKAEGFTELDYEVWNGEGRVVYRGKCRTAKLKGGGESMEYNCKIGSEIKWGSTSRGKHGSVQGNGIEYQNLR